ncbi:hypothetical protein NKH36_29955 [Mesorhizobium sp. M1312]|uniref:hypothetical protein n=1 Tax=unclassified Mesorhizobium TaxID=325217 RepID=UPI003338AF44
MTMRDPQLTATEPTPQASRCSFPSFGRSPRAIGLTLLMDAPMCPRAAQKPLDVDLFDEASRNQLDLF